jgi:hypothetical protein
MERDGLSRVDGDATMREDEQATFVCAEPRTARRRVNQRFP